MRSIRRRRRPEQAPEAPVLPADLVPGRAEDPVVGKRLRSTVHPRFYAAQVGAPEVAGDVDAALAHFLEHGIHAGARVSALFNEDCYLERLAAHGGGVPAGMHPFLHWLTVGWEQRVVPTVLFDEGYYLSRHRELRRGPEWAFAQYLRGGCYSPARWPGPFAPAYGGAAPPDARERQDPPLVNGMLHLAERYDLRRTSWLEEGVAAGLAKLERLGSERVRALVAKAAAIEPLVLQPKRERWASWPPHCHPMVLPAARVEDVRRSLGGVVRADTVLVLPGTGAPAAAEAVRLVVRALREAEPDATLLVATTEGPQLPDGLADATVTVDLSAPLAGLSDRQRLLGLLDLVRGVRPRRLVVADSALGWEMLVSHGRTLSQEATLGACVAGWDLDEDGDRVGFAVRELQLCLDRLSWVVTENNELRKDLVDRYLLPATTQQRVLSAEAPGDLGLVLAPGEGR